MDPCRTDYATAFARPSNFAGGNRATASRGAHSNRENKGYAGNENAGPGSTTRRSPRGASGYGGQAGKIARAPARRQGALQEITNVAGNQRQWVQKPARPVEPMAGAPSGILSSLCLNLPAATLPPPIVAEGCLAVGQGSAANGAPAAQHSMKSKAPRTAGVDRTCIAIAPILAAPIPQPQAQAQPLSPTEWDMDRKQGTTEYSQEIFNQLFLEETLFSARANYMDNQKEINGKMRAILVDWIVEVHMKYHCRPETLHLTINLIDRYLSFRSVARNRLQLVGVGAMLIATKFEEIQPPELRDFVYITDNAYTQEDVLQMEVAMLTVLGFQIVVPTAAHFLDRLACANKCDKIHKELCWYLVDLALLELRMLRYQPSELVAAAMLLSNELLSRPTVWPTQMVHAARYEEAQLRVCADELRALLDAAPTSSVQTVRRRYMQEQHSCVAAMTFATGR